MNHAKHFVCTQCGWFGKQPDGICDQDICPDCSSDKVVTPLYKNPFDQFNPYTNQNKIGVGSKVWAFGYDNYGTVLSSSVRKGYVKVAWPLDYGRNVHIHHKIAQLGWVKPYVTRK